MLLLHSTKVDAMLSTHPSVLSFLSLHTSFLLVQLLKDKASLCEKVAAVQRRLESQSIAAEHKLQNEIQRIKETALAAEKIRRERWVRENTKKIKVNDTNQMIRAKSPVTSFASFFQMDF